MSGSYERVFQKCPECGAQCGPTAERCWMCNASLSGKIRKTAALEAEAPLADGSQGESPVAGPGAPEALLLLVCALIVIGVGLWTLAPGLGIVYLIVVIPALLAMLVSRGRSLQEPASESESLGERFLILISKFLKTVAVLVLVMFGIVIAVCVFCFVLLASNAIRF